MDEVEEQRGKSETCKSSGQTQNATAEGRSEIGLKNNDDRHREPVGAAPIERSRERLSNRHTRRKANGMPESCGLEREICPECGNGVCKAQRCRLGRLARFERYASRGAGVLGKLHDCPKLSGERIRL